MEIPQQDDLVKDFAERHHLRTGDHLAREILQIRAVSLANILITAGYSSLGEDTLADPAVGLLLNMLHRNFPETDCGRSCRVPFGLSVAIGRSPPFAALQQGSGLPARPSPLGGKCPGGQRFFANSAKDARQRPRSSTLACCLPPHYQSAEMRMANARHLFEGVLDGIKSSLSARLILVGGAAADADPTDMHLALSHNRQSTSESNDSGN